MMLRVATRIQPISTASVQTQCDADAALAVQLMEQAIANEEVVNRVAEAFAGVGVPSSGTLPSALER